MQWAETLNKSWLMCRARQMLKEWLAESDADHSLIAPLSNMAHKYVSMMRRDFNQENLIPQKAVSTIPLKNWSSNTEWDALWSGVLEEGNCARIRSDDPLILACSWLLKKSCYSGHKNMIPISCGGFTQRHWKACVFLYVQHVVFSALELPFLPDETQWRLVTTSEYGVVTWEAKLPPWAPSRG